MRILWGMTDYPRMEGVETGRRAKIVRTAIKRKRKGRGYVVARVKQREYYLGRKTLSSSEWHRLVEWIRARWKDEGVERSLEDIERALEGEGFRQVIEAPRDFPFEPIASDLPYLINRLLASPSKRKQEAAEALVREIEMVSAPRRQVSVSTFLPLDFIADLFQLKITFGVTLSPYKRPRLDFLVIRDDDDDWLTSRDNFDVIQALETFLEWMRAGCVPALAVCSRCGRVFKRGRGRRALCDECRA